MNGTVLSDVDGCIFYHSENMHEITVNEPRLLPGVIEKLIEWRDAGYYIILTTARTQGSRLTTEAQLDKMGVFYDQLVMGLPTGPRVLINDIKPDGTLTAKAINLVRDTGFEDIQL